MVYMVTVEHLKLSKLYNSMDIVFGVYTVENALTYATYLTKATFKQSVIMSSNEINKTQVFKRVLRPRKNKTTQTQQSNDENMTQKVVAKPSSKCKQEPFSLTQFDTITTKDALFLEKNMILIPSFYRIDALDLAPLLLGKFLRRDNVVLRITEVEAYRENDSACHGRFGLTARTAPMFGPGGHAYVYLCYGLHTMLNIVADQEGVGAAVLIRSCAPVAGLETIQQRRGQTTEKPVLLSGPGKVGQALGISTEWSNHPLFTPGGLEILDGPKPEKILVGPRVGIEYASTEDVNALWRFAVADTPWISAPKNTLRTP